MRRMSDAAASRPSRAALASVAAQWLVIVGSLGVALVFTRRLHQMGRDDLLDPALAIAIVVAGIVSAAAVGTVLTLRHPRHPVGWVFLALACAMAISGPLDVYAAYGVVVHPGRLPAASFVAIAGDVSFIPWLVLVALALYLTPTGRPVSRWWGRAAKVTAGAGIVGLTTALLSDRPLDPPLDQVRNPLAIDAIEPVVRAISGVAVLLVGLGLIGSGLSLVQRFRSARGAERQQLSWLALAVVPLPLMVVAAFVTAWTNHEAALMVATGGFVVVVPVAAGLSVQKYRLYDVDRIVSRAFAYVLATVVVISTYVLVVVLVGRASSRIDESSPVAAIIGTLAAVSIATPARREGQRVLDRRFSRRRFDALQRIESFGRDRSSDSTIEEVLRAALSDPTLTVTYWIASRAQWVDAQGSVTAASPDSYIVQRHDEDGPIAAIASDPQRSPRALVQAVSDVAVTQLENAGLRAAISVQLVEVHESRARLAAAQMAERRRIERNLHDGAQQRLLALAFELQAALLNGDTDRLRAGARHGVAESHAILLELRDLANGLHPSVLADGGLGTALDDLAARCPTELEIRCPATRFDHDLEACAWFIVLEAVTNATKHGRPHHIVVELVHDAGCVRLTIEDDGEGGADPHGRGLQGLADRAQAAGGRLEVGARTPHGTIVRGELPCAS
jgi:signal transduction histidine kinase